MGCLLVRAAGSDFELTVGEALSIGYDRHPKEIIELFLTESFTSRVLEPAAAVALLRG
ncbi:encapsulin [Sorangium sp. So ce426]|uniref:encapsulin n=1 Tax=Sorangium sp. So ce426 TaxID=3133312 RepID=UPI003F5BB178